MYLFIEVELLGKGAFLTEKFQHVVESEDGSFTILRGQEFFANESSIKNYSKTFTGLWGKYFYSN